MSRQILDIKPGIGIRPAIRNPISLTMIVICALLSGCQDVQTIWSAETRSPDGHWLASAHTVQHFGPGTAGIITTVYLKRINDSNPPMEVLAFSHDVRMISLAMNWPTPSHLDVTYNSHTASLYFQVVKCAGVDISVRDLSRETTNNSQ